MEKEFRLEDIFDAYRPDLGDSTKFMATLQHELEAAEYLRTMREAERRHFRKIMAVVLVTGVLIGSVLTATILLLPQDTPVLTLTLPGLSAILPLEFMKIVGTLLISLLMGGTVIAVAHLLDAEQRPLPFLSKR